MPDFNFQREVRTPYSEAYTILDGERPVGRADIHFAFNLVHVTLAVDESLVQESIQEIIDAIDADLVDAVGISRDELIVHVFQGRETGVYTDSSYGQNGNDH